METFDIFQNIDQNHHSEVAPEESQKVPRADQIVNIINEESEKRKKKTTKQLEEVLRATELEIQKNLTIDKKVLALDKDLQREYKDSFNSVVKLSQDLKQSTEEMIRMIDEELDLN